MTRQKARREDPDIAEEYDFSKGVRGLDFERAKRGIRFVRPTDAGDDLTQSVQPAPGIGAAGSEKKPRGSPRA